MSERNSAIRALSQQRVFASQDLKNQAFGKNIFGKVQIEKAFAKKLAANWIAAMDGLQTVNLEYLDQFAEGLKQWAIRHGATHYCHWFQPLSGILAEKQDSFLSWNGGSFEAIECLSKKELLQGEADGSSFPTGGMRTTSAGCGYTVWDPSSPPFLWVKGDQIILYIPALFVSYRGEALDFKIPLLRSEQKINRVLLRLIQIAQIPAGFAFPVIGAEQEYFLVDRNLYLLRPDLVLSGRTVYGASPSKGQEIANHYYSQIDPKILSFMNDFEEDAKLLGIPIKSLHNEAAPSQHESSPLFERASIATDHNLILMQLMTSKASQHGLSCLLHEKPFQGVNGSGKHCNWSIATDTGLNLLDPKDHSFVFLVLITAILRGVYENAPLLRAGIGSYQNDWRLGGHEAPPTILSIYLGEALESLINQIIYNRKVGWELKREIDLGLSHVLGIQPGIADRNRTSFLVFNHNRIEFRAVGSSQNIAWPITIINSIVADSLELILDEIIDEQSRHKNEDLLMVAMPVFQKTLKKAQPIIFSGDNYSLSWQEEAKRRGLPNFSKSVYAFAVLRDSQAERVFHDVLTSGELKSRIDVLYEQYAQQIDVEIRLMIELFRTLILPAAINYQKQWSKSILNLRDLEISQVEQRKPFDRLVEHINEAIRAIDDLEKIHKETQELGGEARAVALCDLALPIMNKARSVVDQLENEVDDSLWPLPKYRELLFLR